MRLRLNIFFLFLTLFSFAQEEDKLMVRDSVINDGLPPAFMREEIEIVDTTKAKTKITDSIPAPPDEVFTELGNVEFSPGFSLPTGDFASGNYNNALAGYAKQGYVIGANFSIRLKDYLYIMFSYSRQTNVFDDNAYAYNALNGNNKYKLTALNNWRNHFIQGGLSGQIKLDEGNYITPRVLVGYCLGRSPGYQIEQLKSSPGSTVVPEVIDGEAKVAFAVRVGVGLRKDLTKHVFLSLNPDFYWSSLPFTINKTINKSSSPHQSVTIISISLSVGFRIYH